MHRLFNKQTEEEHIFWMNYTDLLAGLFIIFIIACTIVHNQYREQTERAKVAENNYRKALDSLRLTGNDLDSLKYVVNLQKIKIDSLSQNDLKNQILRFKNVFPYNSYIKVDFDTIRGSIVLTPRNPDPEKDLFARGESSMKPELEDYLKKGVGQKLVKRTMDIWKANDYRDIELRIEGHTDPMWGYNRGTNESFIKNLDLSSRRANKVYECILYESGLTTEEQSFVKKNMISIGYSFSSRLQKNGDINNESQDAASRRIEFRIISK